MCFRLQAENRRTRGLHQRNRAICTGLCCGGSNWILRAESEKSSAYLCKYARAWRIKMSKKKGFIAEFKKFIMRGNVLDMAVGVIVGGAFTSIVTSLNQDILTPLLGIFGGTDFSNLFIKLGSGENAPILYYGNFITAVINFLITALVIFLLVKGINAVGDKLSHKKEEPTAPSTKKCPFCKSEIALDATRCPQCTSQLEEV